MGNDLNTCSKCNYADLLKAWEISDECEDRLVNLLGEAVMLIFDNTYEFSEMGFD